MADQNQAIQEFKYDAFISYRHAELDVYVAEHLHKLLENFKVPRLADKELQKKQKKRINRVFRDKDELPASDNLAEPIEEALRNSQFLIVVCSPRTPESKWVAKEIELFAKYRGRENILAVLIEGEPYEAFPKVMCHGERQIVHGDGTTETEQYEIEPLAADVRGASKRTIYRNLRREVLRLAAPILHCSYDDLKQRHKEQKLKKIILISSVIAAAVLLFGCFMTFQNLQIRKLQSESLASQAAEAYRQGDRQKGLEFAEQALAIRYTPEAQAELTDLLQVYENGETFKPSASPRHDTTIVDMAVNGNNSLILTTDLLNQIYLWDGITGELLYQGDSLIGAVAPDNMTFIDERFAIYCGSGGAALFDTVEKKSQTIETDMAVNQAALSDNHMFLLMTDSVTIRLYDTTTWKACYETEADETGNLAALGALDVTDDGHYLSFGISDIDTQSAFVVVDTKKDRVLYQSELPYTWVEFARLEQDGSGYVLSKDFLSTGSFISVSDEQLIYYNAEGQEQWSYQDKMQMRHSIEKSQKDIMLASGSDLIFLNPATGEERTRVGFSSTIKDFFMNEQTINCYLQDGTAFEVSESAGNYDTTMFLASAVNSAEKYAQNSGSIVIMPSNDIQLYLYQRQMKPEMVKYEPLPSYVSGVVTNAEQNRVLTYGFACNEMLLFHTDDDSHQAVHIPYGENELISLVTQTPDGKAFAVVTNDHVRVYAWEDGVCLGETGFDDYIETQAVSGDGTRLCLQDFNTLYRIRLDGTDSYEAEKIALPEQLFYEFCLNSDGTEIIGRDAEQNGICYHLETGETDALSWKSAYLKYNGAKQQYLVVNEKIGCVELYGENHELLHSLEKKPSMIQNIGFSEDGDYIFIQNLDATLEIYQVSGMKPVNVLSQIETEIGRMEAVTGTGWALYSDETYGATGYLCNRKMEVIARIPKLFGISHDGKTVYTANQKHMLSTELMTVSELKMKAK